MQYQNENLGGVQNSVSRFIVTRPSGHITAGKRICFASPKLPSVTSFAGIPLSEILLKEEI